MTYIITISTFLREGMGRNRKSKMVVTCIDLLLPSLFLSHEDVEDDQHFF